MKPGNIFPRLTAALLSLCLLAGLLPPRALAEEAGTDGAVHIQTVEDLCQLAESCTLDSWSRGLTVELDADLDLTGSSFAGIPTFGGVFNGNGHTLSGYALKAEGSEQGVFRTLQEGATVQNLTVRASVTPAGSRNTVGGIVGSNAGNLLNCTFDGLVNGASAVGGVAGVNEASGYISGCTVTGIVYGQHFVGGIVGENHGVVASCTNRAKVNTTVEQNEVTLDDLTLENMITTESAVEITDIGGVAGSSGGVIRACLNYGTVGYRHIGYNVGGIAGSQTGYIEGCINYGSVYARKEGGGIVGQMEPSSILQYDADTLQILSGQLDTLRALIAKAQQDAGTASDELTGQLNDLESRVRTAGDAITRMLDELANTELAIDPSSIKITDLAELYAQANGSSTLDGTLSGSGAAGAGAAGGVAGGVAAGEGGSLTVATPGPEATATPEPTAAPTATPEITPEPTAAPEATPAPTPEPQPEETEPAAQPEAAESPAEPSADGEAPHARPARRQPDPETDSASITVEGGAAAGGGAVAGGGVGVAGEGGVTADDATLSQEGAASGSLSNEMTVDLPEISLAGTDALTAAKNDLSGSLTGIFDGVGALDTGTGGQALADDLEAITAQLEKILGTLSGAADDAARPDDPESLVTDVSDEDTDADTEGKVYNCLNDGSVEADINAGGIAGAMARENDLDMEDDFTVSGSSSLNFTYKSRIVLRGCTNHGTVAAAKQNAGGIVGSMEMGTVKDCTNTGALDAAGADNVGGIAGKSRSNIRASYAKCTLNGHTNVGGIAGDGLTLVDCRSMVRITADGECTGAVAGTLDESVLAPESGTVTGNYFVGGDTGDTGGIDGISYAGVAEPLAYEDFAALENLPDVFTTLTVRFVADDVTVASRTLQYGDAYPADELPAVPRKEGYTGSWAPFDTSRVVFDETVEAVYTADRTVIESGQKRADGKAILLAEGSFTAGATLNLTESTDAPALTGGALLESWNIALPEDGAIRTLRYQNPSDGAVEIYLHDGDGWHKVETTADGSYLTFAWTDGADGFCALRRGGIPAALAAGGGAALALLAVLAVAIAVRQKKRKQK